MTQEILEDIEIECKDCHQPFIFTAGEQEFFRENGLNPPKRCGMCRLAKKKRFPEDHQ
jgi:hypothetical protein